MIISSCEDDSSVQRDWEVPESHTGLTQALLMKLSRQQNCSKADSISLTMVDNLLRADDLIKTLTLQQPGPAYKNT